MGFHVLKTHRACPEFSSRRRIPVVSCDTLGIRLRISSKCLLPLRILYCVVLGIWEEDLWRRLCVLRRYFLVFSPPPVLLHRQTAVAFRLWINPSQIQVQACSLCSWQIHKLKLKEGKEGRQMEMLRSTFSSVERTFQETPSSRRVRNLCLERERDAYGWSLGGGGGTGSSQPECELNLLDRWVCSHVGM